jgi:hypothetical protein
VAAARHDRNVRPTIATATAIRELAEGVRVLRTGPERSAPLAGGAKKTRLAVAPPAPPAPPVPHRHITTHRPLQNHPRHLIQAAVRSQIPVNIFMKAIC